ncbi:hypothetical protein JQ582_34820 [Bradyrhizobium japonicum]|uniref:hypothetical protein n=1 Tax=Bradyrhizobium japonicum TaxID=375 RepID=UPI001BA90C04|nr:hypothetical protein [Bradyrhizobium japonicum]MBR0749116.1 hypothetical protein [Bradyrhizobium japonicum]
MNNDTPTALDIARIYGTAHLRPADFIDLKYATTITDVRKEAVWKKGRQKLRFVMSLEGPELPMVVKAEHVRTLVAALGPEPASWVGAAVFLYATKSDLGDKSRSGLRLGLHVVSSAEPGPSFMDEPGHNDTDDSSPD